MLWLWQWILALLASMASDPTQAQREQPLAAAAVAAARASMQVETTPAKSAIVPCPTGKCPMIPGASPSHQPAKPSGGR